MLSSKQARGDRNDLSRPLEKRHRSMTSPDHVGDTDSPPRIWLDLLPREVIEKIAVDVSGRKRTTDALHLAQASPVQRKAILTAISHVFSEHDTVSVHDDIEWIACFGQDAHKVEVLCRRDGPFSTLVRREVALLVSLLSGPNMKTAEVSRKMGLLRVLTNATSVQELTVQPSGNKSRERLNDETRLLLKTLSTLPLRKLELACDLLRHGGCVFRRIEQLSDTTQSLARCCPNLAVFGSPCRCIPEEVGESFWAIWSTLLHIREVGLLKTPPDWIMPRLQTLKSVQIGEYIVEGTVSYGTKSLTLANRLGACVTILHLNSWTAATGQIAALSKCVNMSEMRLNVGEGVEGSLEEAVAGMPGLQSLVLQWFPSFEPVRVVEYWQVGIYGPKERIYLSRYREAATGTMLRIVHQIPCLTHLELHYVRIGVTELMGILKYVGNRLKHFGVAFHDQYESSADRCIVLLENIIENNQALRSVSAKDHGISSFLFLDNIDERFLNGKQLAQLRTRKSLVRGLVRRVRNYVPCLDLESLKSWINSVQWIDGVEV